MPNRIKFDSSYAESFITAEELKQIEKKILDANSTLIERKGPGSEFTGWIDLPVNYDREEFARIKESAAKIRSDSDVLVVIGIGGSYLGAKAAIEALSPAFYNEARMQGGKNTAVFFAGNNISGRYLEGLISAIGEKDFSVNVISKSGTTTEPAVAFRVFKELLEKKYGKEGAAERIYATTDKARGALKQLADANGYETFVVPDDIGGRYSVLTAVGLLPIAAAGLDIDKLMEGAAKERTELMSLSFEENDALLYAAYRNLLYNKGKEVEILANYEPGLHYISEWWKQLYGESEGKGGKGIFPASVDLTTDLHSMGQYIQDGNRILMETVICVDAPAGSLTVKEEENDLDGLNYLAGKTIDYINKQAMTGTLLAHTDGSVPNFVIHLPKINEYHIGQLFYFFEYACGVSGYALGVNPFDQPGVESYKKNMFALLGKPGFEERREELLKRIR